MTQLWYMDINPFTKAQGMGFKIEKQIISATTPYQRADIFENSVFGKILVLDGVIQLSEKDEFIYHEMLTHVPLLTHPSPTNVLIIGGGDGCCLREVLKHEPEHVTLVDIDEQIIELCKTHLGLDGGALTAQRAEIMIEDGSNYVKHFNDQLDVIILDATDAPSEASKSLLTSEFYSSCHQALRDDGLLVTQGGVSPFGKPEQEVLKENYRKLEEVFPITKVYMTWVPSFASLWPFILASKKHDPLNPRRWEGLTNCYTYEQHINAFSLPEWLKL